jgi:hypothetical protein
VRAAILVLRVLVDDTMRGGKATAHREPGFGVRALHPLLVAAERPKPQTRAAYDRRDVKTLHAKGRVRYDAL